MKKFCNRIVSLFTEKTLPQNIAMIFIALLVTLSFSTLVNAQVDKINSNKIKDVSITFLPEKNADSIGYDVCILDNSAKTPKNVFHNVLQALENTDIKYTFLENEYKDSQDVILFDAKVNSNKTFVFQYPYYSNASIDFISNSGSGKVRVECENFSREYDLYIANTRSIVRCTPICEGYSHLIPYFVIYVFIFILAVFAIYFLKDNVLDKLLCYCNSHKNDQLIKYKMKIDFPIIFVLLSFFSLIQYFTGSVPGYFEGGDQNHYWNQISALSNIDDFKSIPDFRGYLCYLIPALCKSVEFHLGINAVAMWIVFLNFLAAVLFAIIFPFLSKKLYNTDITRPQIYLSVVIMCVLLRGQLLYVLMDLPSAVFLFSGLTLYIYFLDNPSVLKGIFCGASFAAAVNLRSSYNIAVIGTIAIWTIYICVKKKKSGKLNLKNLLNRKNIFCTVALIFGFFIICIPELLINCSKGVISLTPFEKDTSWSNKFYSIGELGANAAFDNMRAYPGRSKTDLQVQNIKIDFIGDTTTILNLQQLFEMFIRKPIDTLVFMTKKIFLGFNSIDPFVYSGEKYTGYKNSFVWLSCLLNYLVFFSGIYSVFKSSKNTKEKIVLFMIFGFIILPLTIVTVEWRYYLSGYLFAIFLFTYHFIPKISNRNIIDSERSYINGYCKGFVLFLIAAITICATIT